MAPNQDYFQDEEFYFLIEIFLHYFYFLNFNHMLLFFFTILKLHFYVKYWFEILNSSY